MDREGREQGDKQIITADYKFSLTEQIASKAKPSMVSSEPQDEHRHKREGKHSDTKISNLTSLWL